MQQRIWQSNLTGYFIIAGIILFAVVVCGGSLYGSQISVALRGLEPSCTIGDGPTTITVQAWSANDDCQQMLGNPHNFTGVYWGGITNPMSEPNTDGVVSCEMDIAGRHVTVRGGSNGGVFCTMLYNAQFGGAMENGVKLPVERLYGIM